MHSSYAKYRNDTLKIIYIKSFDNNWTLLASALWSIISDQ